MLKFIVLLLCCLSFIMAVRPPPCKPDPYPVFWNVGGLGNASDIAMDFGILDPSLTQTGGRCTTPHCQPWRQGLWPIIDNSGHPINGGVPQMGNLSAHLEALKQQIPLWIPDPNWNGHAVIDFESWTNVWDLNTGHSTWHSERYQKYSKELVKKAHPDWSDVQIEKQAAHDFETAATEYMVKTLETCRSVRPQALWGYYGFPQNYESPCTEFNGTDVCGYDVPVIGPILKGFSDRQQAIYNASSALYPSIYIFLDCNENEAYVRSVVHEAQRVSQKTGSAIPVLPFHMAHYHDIVPTQFLRPEDLKIAIETPHELGADGLIIWGYWSAPDPAFESYVKNSEGPLVWNYLEQLCGSQDSGEEEWGEE